MNWDFKFMDTNLNSLLLDLGLDTVVTHIPADPTLPIRKLLTPVPDEPGNYTLCIDNSSLENFEVCSRLAEYHLVESREPATPSPALSFGGALHKGLEIIYRHGISESSISIAKDVIQQHFFKHPTAPDEYRSVDFCLRVLDGYLAMHPVELFSIVNDAVGPWVERSFRLPLGALDINATVPYPWQQLCTEKPHTNCINLPGASEGFFIGKIYILWTGRIDMVIDWDGKTWVLDHKTTSRGGESFYDDFYLSQQMIGYTWAGQQLLNRQIAGVVVNAFEVRRPTKTGNAITYNRRRYEYTPEQLTEWEHNTLTLVTDFLHHLRRGYFPMETKWCFGKYGKCKYFDICRLPSAQRKTALGFDSFRNVTWSPENPTE